MTNTLTPEQIAQGWIAYTGQSLDPLAFVQIYTPGGGWEFGMAGDFDFTQPTDDDYETDPIGHANNFITMYRTFSPNLPSPPVSGEAVTQLLATALDGLMRLYDDVDEGDKTAPEFVAACAALRQFRGFSPLTSEPVGVTISRDEIALIMTEEWNEICNDTSCHPLDITHGNGSKLFFKPSHWVDQIADRLSAAIGERG